MYGRGRRAPSRTSIRTTTAFRRTSPGRSRGRRSDHARRIPAIRCLATWLVLATTAASARAEPPGAGPVEPLRQRLLAAHRAAATLHRGYEIDFGGALWGRAEMFRQGERHGLRLERLGGDPGRVDIACDGTYLVERSGEGHDRVLVTRLRSDDAGAGEVRKALEAIDRMYGLEVPRPKACEFSLTVPTVADAPDPRHVGLALGLHWRVASGPDWLEAGALAARPEAGAVEGDLVAVRVRGFDALLHASDGCIARLEGMKPGTGRPWALRESPPRLTPADWLARIVELGQAAERIARERPPDETARDHLVEAVGELAGTAGVDFGSAAFRRPVVDLLCNVAWAGRATTLQWRAAVRRAQAAVDAQRPASAPRAARSVEGQDALIHEVEERLMADFGFSLDSPEADEDLKSQCRRWIADRIRLLWTSAGD